MKIHIRKDEFKKFYDGATTKCLKLSLTEESLLGDFQMDGPTLQYGGKWRLIDNEAPQHSIPPLSCSRCQSYGYEIYTFRDSEDNVLTVNTHHVCQECCWPLTVIATERLLPPLYKWVNYKTLEPFQSIPVPMEVQKKLISEVQSGEMYGHSVLYCGPSRTGKTVLASALLQRMIHLYVTEGFFSCFRGCHPPIYRVNADRWLEQYEEWKYFDFKSERPRPTRPEPNPESVSKLLDRWAEKQTEPDQRRDCPDDFPPVLILEEIDKFNGTDSKCRALESLLNTVFELRGMIVSTSNLSKAEIKERFPDWLYRRLVESSVDHKIRVRDLHDVVNAKKPHSKRLRA